MPPPSLSAREFISVSARTPPRPRPFFFFLFVSQVDFFPPANWESHPGVIAIIRVIGLHRGSRARERVCLSAIYWYETRCLRRKKNSRRAEIPPTVLEFSRARARARQSLAGPRGSARTVRSRIGMRMHARPRWTRLSRQILRVERAKYHRNPDKVQTILN